MTERRIGYRELEHAGRLGNQLWQIGSTLGFARAHDTQPVFPEDWSYRPYFCLPDEWYGTPVDLRRAEPAQKFSDLPGIQPHYLQQWEYIRWVMDELHEAFAPSKLAAETLAEHLGATGQGYLLDLPDGTITVHVRHGDNLNLDTHPVGTWPVVTSEYYRAAINVIGDPLSPLVVFSDKPEWCVGNFAAEIGHHEGGMFVVHSGPTRPPEYEPGGEYAAAEPLDWIDLQLMGMFQRHIIANSTYSLWGALLGPGPTIYPDNWVGSICRPQVPDESSMVPPEWVMVHNPVGEEHFRAV